MPRAEGKGKIANVRTGQELAQAEQLVEGRLAQPFALIDNEPPRDRQDPAKAENADLEKPGK
jgi:hypothetical protein